MHPADCTYGFSSLSALWLQFHVNDGSEAVRCGAVSCCAIFARRSMFAILLASSLLRAWGFFLECFALSASTIGGGPPIVEDPL